MAKKIIVALLAVISAVFFALGCNHSATISLDQSELTLVTGGTATLEATVDGSEEEVVWTTSNAAVATVSGGTVTAVASGEAVITASVGDASATCAVSVLSDYPVFTVTPANISVMPEGTAQITARLTLGAETVSGATFSYETADSATATVSSSGLVTGVAYGETTITVNTEVYGLELTRTVNVTVQDLVEIRTNVTSLELSLIDLVDEDVTSGSVDAQLYVNDELQSGATISFESGDAEVFTVDETGAVTPVGVGNATLTITGEYEGRSASNTVAVSVVNTVCTEFEAEITYEESMFIEGSQELSAVVTPWNDALSATWEIENNGVGTITPGETPLTATYALPDSDYYGGLITLSLNVEGIEAGKAEITVYVPVSTEQDLVDINNRLDGYYMMTNDIVMTNNVQGNIIDAQTETPYTSAFRDMDGNEVWAYNHAVITQRLTLASSGSEEWNGTFTGVFDGNGHTVSDLRVYYLHFDGLFGNNAGIIRNLRVEIQPWQSSSTHWRSIRNQGGAIAADNAGVIDNCSAKVVLVSTANATNATAGGGIVGRLMPGGSVTNCYAEVTWRTVLDSNNAPFSPMGGIVGMVMAEEGQYTLENCLYQYVTDAVHDPDGSNAQRVTLVGNNSTITGVACGAIEKTYDSVMLTTQDSQEISFAITGADYTVNGWSVLSGGGTVVQDETDSSKAVYTLAEGSTGGTVTVRAAITISGADNEYSRNVDFVINVYIPVSTEAELHAIGDNLGGWYLLMNDIAMQNNIEGVTQGTAVGDETIYAYTGSVIPGQFTGVFDGNGFTISDLRFVYNTTAMTGGLFNNTNASSVIRNVAVIVDTWANASNANQIFRNQTGPLVGGIHRGLIENCYTEAVLMGAQNAWSGNGGIVGYLAAAGRIENCYAKIDWCDVLTTGGGITNGIGTLVGHADAGGTLVNCWAQPLSSDHLDKLTALVYDNGSAIEPENCGMNNADGSMGDGFDVYAYDSSVWNIEVTQSGEGETATVTIASVSLVENCTYTPSV